MQLTGLEPATFRFVAGCSIQLSYSYIYENIIKHIYNIFNMKFIFKGNFRGKLARSTLNPFNINNYKIVCVRFVARYSIQLSYSYMYIFNLNKYSINLENIQLNLSFLGNKLGNDFQHFSQIPLYKGLCATDLSVRSRTLYPTKLLVHILIYHTIILLNNRIFK